VNIPRPAGLTLRKSGWRWLGRVIPALAVGLLLAWAAHGWHSAGAQAALETLWALCSGGA
jgi:hypothetical protein